ncbi:MAG TPA: PAS domain-containing protein [Gammaproteobacteria bacterium]|nr:PAS domain-containing protein [Gammaproteobacteria bacterium]
MACSTPTILQALSTAVLTLDGGDRIQTANPAAEAIFEQSASRLLGQSLGKLCGPNNPLHTILQQARQARQRYSAREIRLTLPWNSSVITIDCTLTPEETPDEPPGLVVEIVQIDRLLRLARDNHLLARQKSIKRMIRGLAHEIKNPLGGLRGAAQLLERELGRGEMREFTRIITHEADRLSQLVDRMTGGYTPLQYAPLNIHALLEHVRRVLQIEVRENLSFCRDYDPSLPDILGHKESLIQALFNILRNAIEALGGKGRIHLRTRIERHLTIAETHHRQVVRVDIEDNGPGISPAVMDNIFEPLITDKADGSGLGLTITRDIIHKHHGLVEYCSHPGCTCFSLYLPIASSHGEVEVSG